MKLYIQSKGSYLQVIRQHIFLFHNFPPSCRLKKYTIFSPLISILWAKTHGQTYLLHNSILKGYKGGVYMKCENSFTLVFSTFILLVIICNIVIKNALAIC